MKTTKTKEELESLIGKPPEGSHPDEWQPRGETWHDERKNWQSEVERLREALMAAKRIAAANYVNWNNAGGGKECEHGYSEAVPCPACDLAKLNESIERAGKMPNERTEAQPPENQKR